MMEKYLDFVRYLLNPKAQLVMDPANIDWEGLFQFADEQGILGLAFQGFSEIGHTEITESTESVISHTDCKGVKSPTENAKTAERVSGRPDFDLMLEWGFVAQQIEEHNKAVNVAAVKLLRILRENGFEGCVLKGQGNSLLYPNPYRRTPGDIDIWVRSERKCKKGDVRRLICFVKERNSEAQITYHHIDGGECNGVAVEVHYRPSFMTNPFYNHRMQRWFERMAPEQFAHEVELPDSAGKITIPTHDFNLIFLLSHIYRHVLYEGIGLRQFVDYYFLLMSDRRGQTKDVSKTLKSLGMERIAGAVMWVLHAVLGLDEKYLIAPMNERLGRVLQEEIFRGGNFGQFDADNIKADSPFKKNWQRIKRDARLMRYFPSEALCEPLFRIWHFFWRILH